MQLMLIGRLIEINHLFSFNVGDFQGRTVQRSFLYLKETTLSYIFFHTMHAADAQKGVITI